MWGRELFFGLWKLLPGSLALKQEWDPKSQVVLWPHHLHFPLLGLLETCLFFPLLFILFFFFFKIKNQCCFTIADFNFGCYQPAYTDACLRKPPRSVKAAAKPPQHPLICRCCPVHMAHKYKTKKGNKITSRMWMRASFLGLLTCSSC